MVSLRYMELTSGINKLLISSGGSGTKHSPDHRFQETRRQFSLVSSCSLFLSPLLSHSYTQFHCDNSVRNLSTLIPPRNTTEAHTRTHIYTQTTQFGQLKTITATAANDDDNNEREYFQWERPDLTKRWGRQRRRRLLPPRWWWWFDSAWIAASSLLH